MTDLTNRLSKAVWEYLDTANLRSEPFSLSRIEEVIAGVMATDSKVPVNVVRHPEYLAQQKISIQVLEQANRKRQADFMERYKAQLQEPTSPVTYDLSADPDAFKKARVGDAVIVNVMKDSEYGKMLLHAADPRKWRRADVETLGDGFTSMNRIA